MLFYSLKYLYYVSLQFEILALGIKKTSVFKAWSIETE